MASSCDICDFEPDTYTATQNVTLHGITSSLTVAGIGYVNWTFTDTHGSPVTMRIHAIHVPGLSVQLLSPQQLITENPSQPNNSFVGGPNGMIIVYDNKIIHFPYDPKNRLPMRKTEPGVQRYASFCARIENLPTDIQPTPFYVHAYNAYTVSQETNESDGTPNHEEDNTEQDDTDSSLPPEPPGLSKTQRDLLRLHH